VARFLFVVPPLAGHINPTVAVGQHLNELGHDVAWVGYPRTTQPLLSSGATLFELDDNVPDAMLAQLNEKSGKVRGLASVKFLWEDFLVPLARHMRPGVAAAVKNFGAHVLVVDQQALAGALVARQLGLRWATSATTSAGIVENPVGPLVKVWDWVLSQMITLETEVGIRAVPRQDLSPGLEPAPRLDLSPELVLVFSSQKLLGDERVPDHFEFVGPSLTARKSETPFPWNALREGLRILVSLGTVSGGRDVRFYQTVKTAFAEMPLQVVLVGPPELIGAVPANFIVKEFVPQLELLEHVDAVVCHGGHNTVCEALARGLPLVVTPIRDDQPVVANQVVASGAGLRLSFGRLQPDQLREAVFEVLNNDQYRTAAIEVKKSFDEAGGAKRAAELLVRLL